MTKRIHPAAGARTITGATSLLALVGIVSGFQFAAHAQEASLGSDATATPGTTAPQAIDPATGQPVLSAEVTAPVAEAVPAPAGAGDAGATAVVAPTDVPAAVPAPAEVAAPVPAPAPAPVVAPAPAPAPAPVNGTTGGSGTP
jgi:hypothetical protein